MKDNSKFPLKSALFVLIGIFFLWVLYMARGVLWPFVLAFLLVYTLIPMVDYLCSKKIPRLLAVVIVYFMLIGIFVVILLIFIPQLVNNLQKLSQELPQYTDTIKRYMGSLQEKYEELGLPWQWGELTNQILQGINNLLGRALTNITKMFSVAFLLVLSLIVSFYLLKDARHIKEALVGYLPKKYRRSASEFIKDIDAILGGYVRGQLIVATIVGVCIGVGLFLLGVQYAFFLGLIAGIFNIVPYLGPVIAVIPALLTALTKDPASPWIFLWIILLFIGVNQVEGFILSPHILGREVRLHPVAVIFAIIIGGAALGILGVLLAIPALAVTKVLFLRLTREE